MHATHSPATVCRAVVHDEIGARLDRQLLQAFSVFEANSERIRLRVSGSGFSTMSNTRTHGRLVTGAPELNP
jgi:hypothetical protein